MNFKLKQKIMHTIQLYQEFLSDYLQSQYETKEPRNLYEFIIFWILAEKNASSAHANEC
jgi:hypothetical protein